MLFNMGLLYWKTERDETCDAAKEWRENHRKDLLQKVHEGEKQIGCLDYLVYQIDRSRSENEI